MADDDARIVVDTKQTFIRHRSSRRTAAPRTPLQVSCPRLGSSSCIRMRQLRHGAASSISCRWSIELLGIPQHKARPHSDAAPTRLRRR